MTDPRTTTAPLVLATDGTAASDGALRYAVQQARMRRADLRIVHVMPMAVPLPPLRPVLPADLEPYARSVLTRAAKEARDLAPGLAISTMLGHGSRVRAILDCSVGAPMVVVGRETSHGIERLLTGATTAAVASNAECPVVVVPGDWHPRDDGETSGTVVVGIRGADDASHVMAAAYEQAVALGATITVVHAWELPDPYIDRVEARTHGDEWEAQGKKLLDEAIGYWRDQYPYLPIETKVVHGHAASVLVAAGKAADLVVVRRAHEHRPFDHLGATVRALLLASPAPVEVVPARAGAWPHRAVVSTRAGDTVT
jgi:nucleotide-binding universal stress UspA family protein